jgi:hypothetical protein
LVTDALSVACATALNVKGNGGINTDDIIIKPNPADSFIDIILPPRMNGDFAYRILSMQGKVVQQGQINKNSTRLSTVNLSAALYVVSIMQNNKEVSNTQLQIIR